jgi:hypothetical protein
MTFRALAILQKLCAEIDLIYIEEVGPFGQMVTAEAREAWLASGNKTRTRDVEQYIALLALEIDDQGKRIEFITRAKQLLGGV